MMARGEASDLARNGVGRAESSRGGLLLAVMVLDCRYAVGLYQTRVSSTAIRNIMGIILAR